MCALCTHVRLRAAAMDPVLAGIIRSTAADLNDPAGPASSARDLADFTNRIIMSKRDNVRYYLRMIYVRLNSEFDLEQEAPAGDCEGGSITAPAAPHSLG